MHLSFHKSSHASQSQLQLISYLVLSHGNNLPTCSNSLSLFSSLFLLFPFSFLVLKKNNLLICSKRKEKKSRAAHLKKKPKQNKKKERKTRPAMHPKHYAYGLWRHGLRSGKLQTTLLASQLLFPLKDLRFCWRRRRLMTGVSFQHLDASWLDLEESEDTGTGTATLGREPGEKGCRHAMHMQTPSVVGRGDQLALVALAQLSTRPLLSSPSAPPPAPPPALSSSCCCCYQYSQVQRFDVCGFQDRINVGVLGQWLARTISISCVLLIGDILGRSVGLFVSCIFFFLIIIVFTAAKDDRFQLVLI